MKYRADIDDAYEEACLSRHTPLIGGKRREVTYLPVRHHYGNDESTMTGSPVDDESGMEWYLLQRKDKKKDRVRRPILQEPAYGS